MEREFEGWNGEEQRTHLHAENWSYLVLKIKNNKKFISVTFVVLPCYCRRYWAQVSGCVEAEGDWRCMRLLPPYSSVTGYAAVVARTWYVGLEGRKEQLSTSLVDYVHFERSKE
jgi:hypothetical protein